MGNRNRMIVFAEMRQKGQLHVIWGLRPHRYPLAEREGYVRSLTTSVYDLDTRKVVRGPIKIGTLGVGLVYAMAFRGHPQEEIAI